MCPAAAPSRPAPPAEPAPTGRAHWLRVAREAADDLATDTVVREQAGKAPLDEVSRLREAGLLTLPAPAGSGGGSTDWATAYAVVREISTADGAIGQLLGSHYFLSWSARFFADPGVARRTAERSAAEQWCWGGGFAPQEPPLTLSRTSRGLVLGGRQSYPTGVLVADRVAVRAVRGDTGEPLAVVVDPARPGSWSTRPATPSGSGSRPAAAWSSTTCRWAATTSSARCPRTRPTWSPGRPGRARRPALLRAVAARHGRRGAGGGA